MKKNTNRGSGNGNGTVGGIGFPPILYRESESSILWGLIESKEKSLSINCPHKGHKDGLAGKNLGAYGKALACGSMMAAVKLLLEKLFP